MPVPENIRPTHPKEDYNCELPMGEVGQEGKGWVQGSGRFSNTRVFEGKIMLSCKFKLEFPEG